MLGRERGQLSLALFLDALDDLLFRLAIVDRIAFVDPRIGGTGCFGPAELPGQSWLTFDDIRYCLHFRAVQVSFVDEADLIPFGDVVPRVPCLRHTQHIGSPHESLSS